MSVQILQSKIFGESGFEFNGWRISIVFHKAEPFLPGGSFIINDKEGKRKDLQMHVWHDAKIDPPGIQDINTPVLAIREIGQGKCRYRKYDICIYNARVDQYAQARGEADYIYDGRWNKMGITHWTPMPKMPEKREEPEKE